MHRIAVDTDDELASQNTTGYLERESVCGLEGVVPSVQPNGLHRDAIRYAAAVNGSARKSFPIPAFFHAGLFGLLVLVKRTD
jgi:hypothetical protein